MHYFWLASLILSNQFQGTLNCICTWNARMKTIYLLIENHSIHSVYSVSWGKGPPKPNIKREEHERSRLALKESSLANPHFLALFPWINHINRLNSECSSGWFDLWVQGYRVIMQFIIYLHYGMNYLPFIKEHLGYDPLEVSTSKSSWFQ